MTRSLEGGAPVEARPVRGVIFDLGGTLVYQNPLPELDRERRQCEAIARLVADQLGCRAPIGWPSGCWRCATSTAI